MAYGFGGKPKGKDEVSHCFPLNGNEDDASISGLDKMMTTYKDALQYTSLYGPTLFEPVIQKVISSVKKMEKLPINLYHVLLILTDGCIHDMRATIDQIVSGSVLPLSIIIVGIGDADFSNMEILDADKVDLVDSKLNTATRDIVQFVKYADFSGDIGLLAEQVLCEVPDQLVEYMMLNDKHPNSAPPQKASEKDKEKKKKDKSKKDKEKDKTE